jgi:uncharacterized protein YcbK (DUF882 family)
VIKVLSKNFKFEEFRCPCQKCKRTKVRVSSLLLFKLEMVKIAFDGKSVIVLSGTRCPEENKRVGGHFNSAHIPNPDGEAADIKIKGVKPIDIGLAAEKIGGMRIGIAKTYAHLDIKPPSPSRFWIYIENKIIYSVNIENKNLLKFYQIVTEGR